MVRVVSLVSADTLIAELSICRHLDQPRSDRLRELHVGTQLLIAQ